MAKLEDKIRQYAAEYIEAFRARGECEYMSEFAFEFPIKVFLELMGLPLERAPEFLQWEYGLLHEHDMAKVAEATRLVVGYLRSVIAERKANPTNDALGYAVQGQVEGRPLNDDELVGFAFNLFIGGLDTVSTNMGLQTLHLAQNIEHQRYLRENPDRIPRAIEELMRAYAAVTTFRTVTKPTEFKGIKMMPGDKVAMMTTLAARDPEEFENPSEVRLDRTPRHVSFGFGVHTCIGMHLARRELRIAHEEMLARLPEFSIKPGHTIRRWLGMIQPVELPLVWAKG
jgi:cytochrome P450